ncbi:MAG: FAD-dependent oxidoreductase [Legionellaceae bacterium]|nr:FAD-dependent oxidoreductase [Legionellaceae bacterium]
MKNGTFDWAVVGAGPAGIAVVGKLLDKGVLPSKIIWFDPSFAVGDLGRFWGNVSSNTKVQLFLDFLNSCKSFSYQTKSVDFEIDHFNINDTCTLKHIVKPLLWVTEQLTSKVQVQKTMIKDVSLANRTWSIKDSKKTYLSKNVVLATGSEPVYLDYPKIKTLSFADAINPEVIVNKIDRNATYAVFGSSHSAIIIIRNLVENGAKRVINFYRSPSRYALDMGDWILFDNTGLKGQTANWSREYIDGKLPDNLERYISNQKNIDTYLQDCDFAVYAVGFSPRKEINVDNLESLNYNPYLGIIGPGLFGLGIAYPEKKSDPFGNCELQVGLGKFMKYLDRIIPTWMQYST